MNTTNWGNALPETRLLWDYLKATFTITAIVPLYFQNAIVGSEFLTYAATKLYMALEIEFTFGGATGSFPGFVSFYNQLNLTSDYGANNSPYWDATAAVVKQDINTLIRRNLYFSRFINTIYPYLKFIGYRLTIS